MGDIVAFAGIAVSLLVAAFAAMGETAIARLGRVKAHHLAQEKKRGADALVRIADDPAPYMNALLLLRLLSHVSAAVLATGIAIRAFDDAGEIVAAVIMTMTLFVFAEVVPKTFAVQRLEGVALRLSPIVSVLGTLLRPLGKGLVLLANATMVLLPGRGLPQGPFVTQEQLRLMVDKAEADEEIEEEERELIHSIFEFGDTVVREVMVPRPDMITLAANTNLDEALKTIVSAGYSRIPLYEGDTDNIVGLLYAKDVLKRVHESDSEAGVAALGRPPTFVPEQKKVAELLREMQEHRVHMAIVVDEYGGTAGLVTIEDLIEEIVGEIVDEYDQEEPLVEPLGADRFRVDAKMPIDEVNELLGAELPHEEWDTVGGLVFGLTGRVPVNGEKVDYDGLQFTAERVTGRRIQKVVIARNPGASEASSG